MAPSWRRCPHPSACFAGTPITTPPSPLSQAIAPPRGPLFPRQPPPAAGSCQGWPSTTAKPVDPSAWLEPLLPALRSPAGAVAFVLLYALWVTLLLPGVWASMLAGALYGTFWASVIVFLGASLGAIATFLVGRHWLRGWTRRRLQAAPKLLAIERAVSHEGLKLVLLTRLSPAFPFSLLNLAYGLSEVTLRDYVIGLIAILPGTVLFCALGELAGDVARFGEVLHGEADPGTWALRILGLLATVGAIWVSVRAAQRALGRPEPPR